LPFTKHVRWNALGGLPLGAIASWFAWDGRVSRSESVLLVGLCVLYVAIICRVEKHAPSLGEVDVLEKSHQRKLASGIGRELFLVLLGIAAMVSWPATIHTSCEFRCEIYSPATLISC
jgi:hypothetical protein